MQKPLHPMTTAEAVAAYGVEPTFHEIVGHAIDTHQLNERYAALVESNVPHKQAKMQAYEATFGREYPYGMPAAQNENDLDIIRAHRNDKAVNQLKKQQGRRMAYAALAGLITGGGIGLLLNGKRTEEN